MQIRVRFLRVLLQVLGQALVDDAGDDALHLGVVQPDLGLRLELRLRVADADDRGQPLAEVLAVQLESVLEEVLLLAVGVDGPGQAGAEAGQVRAAAGVVGVVGVAADSLSSSPVGVLQGDLDATTLVSTVVSTSGGCRSARARASRRWFR